LKHLVKREAFTVNIGNHCQTDGNLPS
jgi:hypothetical protein